MKEPELYHATDRRCYNGAFCSDMEKEINSRTKVLRTIQEARPDYRCVYFPVEGKFLSFISKDPSVPIELTGNMFENKGQCLLEAWRIIIAGETK